MVFRDFRLGDFDSAQARANGPLVVVIWRTTCPTCRLALPFFDRMHRAYTGAAFVGVAQDDASELRQYVDREGLGFSQLPDEDMKVSSLYEVEVVPQYFLTDGQGTILASGQGWDRKAIEAFGESIAERVGVPPVPVILDTDSVPGFKPG